MNAKRFSPAETPAGEFLAIPKKIIGAEVQREPSRSDKRSETLEHRAAVLEPAAPDLSCLRPAEWIGQVVVAHLLDSDAVFR